MKTSFIDKLDKDAKQNGGWIKLDLADPEHYAFYMEQMGGESYLAAGSPNLFALIGKTREIGNSKDTVLNSIALNNAAPNNTDPRDTFFIEAVTSDQKAKQSTALNADREGKITKTVLRYLKTKPAVGVVTTMRDGITGEQVKSYPVVYTDTQDIDCILTGDFSRLAGNQQRIFKVSSTVTEVEDTNGLAMLQAKYVAATTYTIDGVEEIMKSYKVLDPATKIPSHTQIKISYDRDEHVPDYDYHYHNVPVTDPQGKRHISVLLPVKIEMEVIKDYHIERLDIDSGYRLYLDYPKGGMCHDLVEIERLEPVISSNGGGTNNVLTLSVPVNWENVLDFDKLENTINTNLNIYGEFNVIVKRNTQPLPLTISLSLKSSNDAVEGPCDKKVLPIFMQWGCMHKETLILMEDASLKKVCQLAIGDKVLSYDGFAYPVMNIVTGPEEKLYQITTSRGKTVRLSSTHTVFLADGPLPAKDVRPGQTALTVNGQEKIVSIEVIDYNDTVYNLVFAKNTSIYGDGVVIGDMQMQQTIRKPMLSKRQFSAQTKAVIEDLRRLSELKGENQ